MTKDKISDYIELMKEFDALPDDQKPSALVPQLPMWHARSFILSGLAAALVVSTLLGFDLFGWFAKMGLGSDPGEVADTLQFVVAFGLQLLAYAERLKPNYKLTWKSLRRIVEED